MARKKVMRFGVIGCGGAGRARTIGMAKDPSVQVVAGSDTAAANVDKLSDGLGCAVQPFIGPDGYREMIDSADLDAVGVFGPHTLHYDHAKYALSKGKHVLIEKPMVCGVGPAIETAKLAKKKGLVYLIHYQRHYEPKYITARQLIQKGEIGEVQSFYVYMAQDWPAPSWRGDPKYSGGGQLNDSGSHYQDILLWMTGLQPKSAIGSLDCIYRGKKMKVEINGSFSVELSNGAAGRLIIIGDYIRPGMPDDVRIMGSKATLLFTGGNLVLHPHGGQPQQIEPQRPKGYPASPGENFTRLVLGRMKTNHVDAIFGARVALLTDTILKAGKSNRRATCESILKRAKFSEKDLR
ncbi:MAG: Gfo/Idh/MocA family oxidoreductase [Planctomycetes bacterium]|nr:Gfo/Idh/MocA family oxidoreductase [Planctomycetota bacterium]